MSAVEVGKRHPVAYEQRGSRAGIRARGNDVLFARITPCLENGKVAMLPVTAEPTGGSTEFIVIRPTTAVDPAFLYYWCLHPDVRNDAKHHMAGVTGRMRLAASDLAKFEFSLPPLPEQHRIVEALEDHLSRLDAAESILSSISRRTENLAAKILDDAILGHASNQPLSSLPAHLRGRHRFRYQDLPSLPEGWKWQLASDVCVSINSGSTPKADLMQQDRGEVPFLKVYNIDPAGSIDFTKNPTFVSRDTHRGQLKRSIALPGDVVTNIVGPPLGKSAVVPDTFAEWNTNQAIVSFRAGSPVRPAWLAVCLRSPFIVNLLKSTAKATAGQFNIALSTCRELPLPVPPLDMQDRLLEEIELTGSTLQHADSVQRPALRRSSVLRHAVLRTAFNGELVDQDPTDEPADIALAKIRDQASAAPRRRRRKESVPT
ncbi:restriction endonuclease subunit S [Nocardia sp. NPDC058176]|uniref:restriction endonuclease subunit S n=1 Tax=Nocardia sp. NPDC058176 TaxID=3346368 RepID=UPI0036DBF25E